MCFFEMAVTKSGNCIVIEETQDILNKFGIAVAFIAHPIIVERFDLTLFLCLNNGLNCHTGGHRY